MLNVWWMTALVLLYVTGSSYATAPQVVIETYYVIDEEPDIGSELFNFTVRSSNGLTVTGTSVTSNTYVVCNVTWINGVNYVVKVKSKQRLDREALGRSIGLDFAIEDTLNNVISSKVDLYLTDINDNPPLFQHLPYRWDLSELPYNASESYTYTRIHADDDDSGANAEVTYGLKANAQADSTIQDYENTFSIDSQTGVVTLLKQLNYSVNNYYQFTVNATDHVNTTQADFIVRVLDVQNMPPFFVGVPYRTNIQENAHINTMVKKVTARDGDTGISNAVNYTIEAGECSSLFNISVTSGEIHTAEAIDRDSGPLPDGTCVLQILVQEIDTHGVQYGDTNSTTDVTITVDDVNDNSPKFGNSTYTAEIQENAALKLPITLIQPTEITVADADAETTNTQMSLSLIYPNGTKCIDFEVVPSTVQKEGSLVIRVNNSELLDYEKVKTITMLIVAEETYNSSHTDTATVTLTVTDMNDNNPQFVNRTYEFKVQEAMPNQIAGTVQATDDDSEEFVPVVYTVYGGNGRFAIDRSTGVVTTACTNGTDCASKLDRETAEVYYMTVTTTDMNGTSGGRSDSVSLIVRLLDINDNDPVFTRDSPIKVFITENDSAYNETLVTVEARDNDEPGSKNSDVWYNITSVSNGMFDNVTIGNETGNVYLTHAVDFEKLNGPGDTRLVEIEIAAMDKGDQPRSSNMKVELEVQDMNDNDPQFVPTTFNGRVYENETSTQTSSAHVGRVSATDDDGSDRNKAISYYIISGSFDKFRINSSSGEVSVQLGASLNRESVSAYNITIYAIDHGSPPLTGSTFINVMILDVNDEVPSFNQSTFTIAVKENTTDTINKTLITCAAHDPDIDADLNYSIIDTEANDEIRQPVNRTLVEDYFKIDPSNGTVFVNALTDRETAETITLTVFVEDRNAYSPRPQNTTALLIITLLDINDNRPNFDQANYTMKVSENALDGTRLEFVRATDRDKNRTITYSLLQGPEPTSSFEIETDTGTIIKNGDIDRETNETVELVVVATDNGVPELNSTVVVTVEIIDFNDNAPIFLNNNTVVEVPENSEKGIEVIRMTAEDKDDGPNAEIKYSFNSQEQQDFAINETTGWITVNGHIDRERIAQYTLQVVAKDQPVDVKEQKSSLITVTVNVADMNDNAPSFDSLLYTVSVPENAGIASTVITLQASDKDAGQNSMISYMFGNDTEHSGLFAIDETVGAVTVNRSLKAHAGYYVFNVTARDHGKPPHTNFTILNVTVTDVNLNKPVIVDVPVDNLLKVYECSRLGYELYKFNYTDEDRGINAEADFNISRIQDDISVFHMHANGSLTLKGELNYTVKHEYQFQIQATDMGIPALSSEKITITVTVIDVNDHLPSFQTENVTLSVAENQPNDTYVGRVTAVDPDMDSVSCYSKHGEGSEYFTVGNNTGEIHTTVAFDRETVSIVSFYIKVRDCSIVSNTSVACGNNIGDNNNADVIDEVRVDVIIDDVDDNPPVFEYEEIVTGIRRTTEVGTILELKLKDKEYVSDNDTDKHGINAWKFANNGTITASQGISIDPESGTAACKDSKKHIFCIAENGSIINNRYFSEDLSGYFLVPVKVYDTSGFDTAKVKIYLIGDNQVLKMVLFGTKENISLKKDDILSLYSRITGHTFVYNGIADHKTLDGVLDTLKTDLFFHVVEPHTQRILSAEEAIRLIDSNALALQEAVKKYSVIEIISSLQSDPEDDNTERTIYILAAVVAVLAVTVIIIVYVAVTTRFKYQNKLKAATVTSTDSKAKVAENPLYVPGSNQYSKQSNPLLNSKLPVAADTLYDNRSLSSSNSLDVNDVGEIREQNSDTVYDTMEEREATMDIFAEDTMATKPEESPLDAALRIHSIQSAAESGGKQDEEETTGDTGPDFVTVVAFDDTAFIGDLESTEI